MPHKDAPDFTTRLAEFRRQIDAIDDRLIALFIERIGVICQVGEMKRAANPGQCPLRPGREADMVRRVISKFQGTAFSPAAAAAMWRLLIGASTSVEGALKLSVYAPEGDDALYWLGREYFGPFIPSAKQALAKRVIGDVMDGKASIGILPLPRGSDTEHWWELLLQSGKDAPKIFAHIPFVYCGKPAANAPAGLAIARIHPEPTAKDVSLLVLETEHNISQNKLQSALAAESLDAAWISITPASSSSRRHLIEVKGFVSSEDTAVKKALSALGESIQQITVLGAYAVPETVTI